MGVKPGEKIVLVNPGEIMKTMKGIPEGKLITIVEICRRIARKHKVKGCCTLTTGIFIMTIANAVEEVTKKGKDLSIPYWRTLKSEGFLNEKYPSGVAAHKELLQKERFRVTAKGKRCFVENHQDYIN